MIECLQLEGNEMATTVVYTCDRCKLNCNGLHQFKITRGYDTLVGLVDLCAGCEKQAHKILEEFLTGADIAL